MAARFAEGCLADATLAAYAEWCFESERIAAEPWFADEGPRARLFALRDTPPAFKRRNLFISTHW